MCRNHIRVYEEIPENIQQPRSLLVCGTQSSVQSECSTVGLMVCVCVCVCVCVVGRGRGVA